MGTLVTTGAELCKPEPTAMVSLSSSDSLPDAGPGSFFSALNPVPRNKSPANVLWRKGFEGRGPSHSQPGTVSASVMVGEEERPIGKYAGG